MSLRTNPTKPIAYEGKYKYIFISYSHFDKDYVYKDLHMFNQEKIRFWYDERITTGSSWVESVRKHFLSENCAAVVFYLSPHSFFSEGLLEEIKLIESINEKAQTKKIEYFSVNIGGLSIVEMLKLAFSRPDKPTLSGGTINLLTRCFDDTKVYIRRASNLSNSDHIAKILDHLNNYNVVETTPQEEYFKYKETNEGLFVEKYFGLAKKVIIPPYFEGKPVLGISALAFHESPNIESIDASDIYFVDSYAFTKCPNLYDITFSESLRRINGWAFFDCESFQTLKIPDHFSRLDIGVSNTLFKKIFISKSIQEIGDSTDYIMEKLGLGVVKPIGDNQYRPFFDYEANAVIADLLLKHIPYSRSFPDLYVSPDNKTFIYRDLMLINQKTSSIIGFSDAYNMESLILPNNNDDFFDDFMIAQIPTSVNTVIIPKDTKKIGESFLLKLHYGSKKIVFLSDKPPKIVKPKYLYKQSKNGFINFLRRMFFNYKQKAFQNQNIEIYAPDQSIKLYQKIIWLKYRLKTKKISNLPIKLSNILSNNN
jgi:hypothetical protein